MGDSKYGKWIVTELREGLKMPPFRHGEVIGKVASPGGADGNTCCGSTRIQSPAVFVRSMSGTSRVKRQWPCPAIGTRASRAPLRRGHCLCRHQPERHLRFGWCCRTVARRPPLRHDQQLSRLYPGGHETLPLRIRRNKPIFQYVLGSGLRYEGVEETTPAAPLAYNLDRQFVFQYKKNLAHPEYRGNIADQPGRHEHIVYLDSEVVPDANFYVEASWFGTAPRQQPVDGKEPTGPQPHVHPFPN